MRGNTEDGREPQDWVALQRSQLLTLGTFQRESYHGRTLRLSTPAGHHQVLFPRQLQASVQREPAGVPVLPRPRPTKVTTVHRHSPQKGRGSDSLLPQSLPSTRPSRTFKNNALSSPTCPLWILGGKGLETCEEQRGSKGEGACASAITTAGVQRESRAPDCLLIKTRKSFLFWDSSVNRPREKSPQLLLGQASRAASMWSTAGKAEGGWVCT